MKVSKFLRTTLIGGVLFLVPLVVAVAIIGKAFQIIKLLASPLSQLIPIETFAGFAFVNLLTVALMLLICLLAGMASRSAPAQKLYEKVDNLLLQLIPGYAWIKGAADEIGGTDAEKLFKPVLVRFDDQYQLGLETNRNDEWAAVYLPGAPDFRSGSLSYVELERVSPVDAGLKQINRTLQKLGRTSEVLKTAEFKRTQ